MFAASSRTATTGGSSLPPRAWAVRSAVSRSRSTIAATTGAAVPAPSLDSRYRVEGVWSRTVQGSSSGRSGPGSRQVCGGVTQRRIRCEVNALVAVRAVWKMPFAVTSAPERAACRSAASVSAPAVSRAMMASRRPCCSQSTTSRREAVGSRAAASRVPVRTCSPAAWKNGSRRVPPMVAMKCPANRVGGFDPVRVGHLPDRPQRIPPPPLGVVGDVLGVEHPHRAEFGAGCAGQRPQVGLVRGRHREAGSGAHGGHRQGAGLVRPRPHDDQRDVLPGHAHVASVEAPDPDPHLITRHAAAGGGAGAGEVGPQLGRLGLSGMARSGRRADARAARIAWPDRAWPCPSPAQSACDDRSGDECGQRRAEAANGARRPDQRGDAAGQQAGEQGQAPRRGGPAAGAHKRGDSGGDPDGAAWRARRRRCRPGAAAVPRHRAPAQRCRWCGWGHGRVRKAVSVS